MVRRAMASDGLPADVSLGVADFDDAATAAAALDGAGRAYLVTPSSAWTHEERCRFADLAAPAGVDHLVVLSQLAADEHSPARFPRHHAAVERHVRDREERRTAGF